LVSFRDEDDDMERERLPSSVSSSFVGEMNSLDLLSQNDPFIMTDNEGPIHDPKEAKQPPSNTATDVKSNDAGPSRAVGAGPSSNAKVSSFSVLSLKSQNNRKNKKAVYEFVIPNNRVKSGGMTKKQHKSHKNVNKDSLVAINPSKSKLLPNLSQLKSSSISQSSQSENVPKSKRGKKKKIPDVDDEQSKLDDILSQPNKGIFSNLRILFISNNIDKIRLNLMKSKVVDKGGIIEENFNGNLTHIITELSGKQLITMLGVRKLKISEVKSSGIYPIKNLKLNSRILL